MTAVAGAAVLVAVTMTSVMVLAEGVMTAAMTGADGLEAEVQLGGADEAEVLGEGETGVLSGRAVLREGQKLSNGTRKEKRLNLVRITMVKLMKLARVSKTVMISSTIIYGHQNKDMKIMTTDAGAFYLVCVLSHAIPLHSAVRMAYCLFSTVQVGKIHHFL